VTGHGANQIHGFAPQLVTHVRRLAPRQQPLGPDEAVAQLSVIGSEPGNRRSFSSQKLLGQSLLAREVLLAFLAQPVEHGSDTGDVTPQLQLLERCSQLPQIGPEGKVFLSNLGKSVVARHFHVGMISAPPAIRYDGCHVPGRFIRRGARPRQDPRSRCLAPVLS
jgi:hypothetical protein